MLGDNQVFSLLEDRKGNVWVGTGGGGVSRYAPSHGAGSSGVDTWGQAGKTTWKTFTTDDGLSGNGAACMLEDRDGTLWFGTTGGVTHYDGRTFTIHELGSIALSMLEDRNGHLWFGTERSGVVRYDGREFKSITTEDGLPEGGVLSILEDREGMLWFAVVGGEDQGGLCRYDGQSLTRLSEDEGFKTNAVHSMFQDRDGTIWFGLRLWDRGVARYDGHTFVKEDDIPNDNVHAIIQDREGHFWFATDGGAVRHSGQTSATFTIDNGLVHDRANAVFEDREGNLWIATNGGVTRYDGRTFTSFTADDVLDRVFSVAQDRDGNLWFAGQAVTRYDGESFTAWTSDDGLAKGVAWGGRVIHHDRDGNLWFGKRSGVTRYDGKTFTTFTVSDGLGRGTVHTIYEEPSGDLLFGTRAGKVSRYDGQTFTTLAWDGLAGDGVWSIYEDRDQALWFGTFDGGVTRYDGREYTSLTRKDGLAHDTVLSVFQDRRGHYWFGTDGGVVSRYDGQVFQTLTREDGLTGQSVRSITEDRDGNIWLATLAGVVRYRPPAPLPPGVFIDAVVADQRYEGVNDFTISSDVELAAFEFRGMSLKTRPGAMVYRYRLNPYHDWRTTREQRVEYQDLPRGDYTFEVVAVDRDLVYSESPAVVALTVHIPYERMGLWSGLVIAIVLVGWQTSRVVRRDRRLREGNQALSDANKELFQVNVDLESVNVDLQREQVLERLRGQALGMQSSDEIVAMNESVFRDLKALGLPLISSGIGIVNDARTEFQVWGTTSGGTTFEAITWKLSSGSPAEVALAKGESYYHAEYDRDQLREMIGLQSERGNPIQILDLPEDQWPELYHSYGIFFDRGRVQLASREAISENHINLIRRFGEAFGFAHARWEELKVKEAQNRRLAVEASVQRLRAEVQSMDEASDFERILSLLTESLETAELSFDGCEIDVLDEPVENPTMELFVQSGFRYTTFRLNPDGNVASNSYDLTAPFPTVNEQTIERFIAGEPWQGLSDDLRIVEVPAGSYGRLRLTATDREQFTEDEIATLREFADAVALGYARYLDIREIQEATERKSAFLASMSHEFRTPMNAIKGFTNLVLRRGKDELSERNQENLEKVDQASDHLLAMINDLLDLSKIEAGRMDVNSERFDVAELVTSACDTVSPLIQEGVELCQDIADDIGEAHTDKARLQQMVINLLSNAIKFTDSGGVTVNAGVEDGQLVIAVSDTGKGIPADELPTIFDEYRQAEGSESSVQKGTGLGLSITKKFAELLGGTIGVESEVGKGSTFTVRVPVEWNG